MKSCGTECPLLDYCPVCGSLWDSEDPNDKAEGPYCDICNSTIPPETKRLFLEEAKTVHLICEDCVLNGIVEGSINYKKLTELI